MDLRAAGVPHTSSPKSWRPIHDARFDFARRHTFIRRQYIELFFTGGAVETREKKASRFLARHRDRIPVRGAIQWSDTGHPRLVYGRKCKITEMLHQVMIAEVEVLTGLRIEPG